MISFEYFKILLLVLFALGLSKADYTMCPDHIKPCHGRGGCLTIAETWHGLYENFTSTECVCVRGYSGRWCQFQDDGVGPAIDDRMHYGIPDTPKILSSGFAIRDPVYNLTWEKPWAPSDDPVLYYALRYRMVGEPKWKNVNEILASATQVVYSYEFHYLEWNVADHEFEVYAGSSEGVSRPAVGIIPKVEYPEIVSLSKDMTVKPVLENTAFILICRVRGKPRPRIYWTLNGHNVFESPHVTTETFSVFAEGDRRGLLVRGASRKIKHGIYKCVAANNWGIVESRGIKVDIKAPAKVRFPLAINKSRAVRVQIGSSAYFKCSKKSIRANSALSYTWGNRYKNSSKNFQIEPSERVWITSYGWLVYSTFRQQDADFINKKGIRCFIKQKYRDNVEEIVSDVLHIVVDKRRPADNRRIKFVDGLPSRIIMSEGQNPEFHCSAISNLGGIVKMKGINGINGRLSNQIRNFEYENNTLQFPNGFNVTNYGRVTKYNNVQTSDSGYIECLASQSFGTGILYTISRSRIEVLADRAGPVLKKLPKIITVYRSSSSLRLGPTHPYRDMSAVWHKDLKSLYYRNGRQAFLRLNLTGERNGFFQVSVSNYRKSRTASSYLQIVEDDDFIKDASVTHLRCVPPSTSSLRGTTVRWYCGSEDIGYEIFGGNSIPREVVVVYGPCRCEAGSDLFLVKRKFDPAHFNVATFSSKNSWAWSHWSSWTPCPNVKEFCSVNIYSTTRYRSCKNPTPAPGGEYCSGSAEQKQACPVIPCPKNATSYWAQWSPWSDCSNYCGQGRKSRDRMCIAPSDRPCPEGEWHEERDCLGSHCFNIVHWGEWSPWSKCSKSCGVGFRLRRRHCPKRRCAAQFSRCHTKCKQSHKDDDEPVSDAILYVPNALAAGTAVLLIVIAMVMTIHNCRKKYLKKSKHDRLLSDLFDKSDVEKEPLLGTDPPVGKKRKEPKSIARFKHKKDSGGNESSCSLASDMPPGSLPPPSRSMLDPSGSIASTSFAGGMAPPPPAAAAGMGGSAPPPPPPPPPPPRRK